VEGFIDRVRVHQAGLPCVVALMRCTLSRRREQLLDGHFREAVPLMDGEKAGRNADAAIAERLATKIAATCRDSAGRSTRPARRRSDSLPLRARPLVSR
jgi:DNA primase